MALLGTASYILPGFEQAAAVVAHAGGTMTIPDLTDREVALTLDNATIFCDTTRKNDETTPEGWNQTSSRRFGCSCPLVVVESDRSNYSALSGIRIGYYVSESAWQDSQTEFFVQHQDGTWKPESKDNVKLLMRSRGCTTTEANLLIGEQIDHPLKITAIPFQEERPEPGVWNQGYQFTCEPEPGDYHHYCMILDHVGKGIDQAVANDPWCREHGIENGGHFLFVYFAVMVQLPDRRTPYLFLQSPENASGKSTLIDAMKLLLDDGAVVAADQALTNQQGFNRELIGGIIYAINETNLGRAGDAYSRMKEYVTNPEIMIHPKGGTPFKVKNWSRCIQTANDLSHCPVGFDDERVIVIQLEKIAKAKVLDWETKLKPALLDERGHFLHALLNYDLPPVAPGSRCFLPILNTAAKQSSIEDNLTDLTDDEADWLQQVLDLAEEGKWVGLLEFNEVCELLSPPKPVNWQTWKRAWRNMDVHFRNEGLVPDSRTYQQNGRSKGKAAWGFKP